MQTIRTPMSGRQQQSDTGNMEGHERQTEFGGSSITRRRMGWRLMVVLQLLVGAQILASSGLAQAAIRNISLQVEPPAIRRGQHATLRCQYDLEGAPLYSVKFYRGMREFYRYSPSEVPTSKIFPFPGIQVDASISNASQVVIRNVGFGLSGNFSCEVTADAPSFSTAMVHIQMQVVEYPDGRPQLWTDHDRYEPGDVLRANCSSPPSRPRVELRLTLNNIVIYSAESHYDQTADGLIASRISLRLHLQSAHFNGHGAGPLAPHSHYHDGGSLSNLIPHGAGTASGLLLRCTAQIADLYEENTELELGVPPRDPVPARVTSSSSGRNSLAHWWLLLVGCAAALGVAPPFRPAPETRSPPLEAARRCHRLRCHRRRRCRVPAEDSQIRAPAAVGGLREASVERCLSRTGSICWLPPKTTAATTSRPSTTPATTTTTIRVLVATLPE